jgi:hypothetical protein
MAESSWHLHGLQLPKEAHPLRPSQRESRRVTQLLTLRVRRPGRGPETGAGAVRGVQLVGLGPGRADRPPGPRAPSSAGGICGHQGNCRQKGGHQVGLGLRNSNWLTIWAYSTARVIQVTVCAAPAAGVVLSHVGLLL